MSHTKGILRMNRDCDLVDSSGTVVIRNGGNIHPDDMRRLCACWNVSDEVPIELLETVPKRWDRQIAVMMQTLRESCAILTGMLNAAEKTVAEMRDAGEEVPPVVVAELTRIRDLLESIPTYAGGRNPR